MGDTDQDTCGHGEYPHIWQRFVEGEQLPRAGQLCQCKQMRWVGPGEEAMPANVDGRCPIDKIPWDDHGDGGAKYACMRRLT